MVELSVKEKGKPPEQKSEVKARGHFTGISGLSDQSEQRIEAVLGSK